MNSNEFTLVKEIGKGGMGSVFEGLASNGTKVAIKMLRADVAFNPEFRELFESEAKVLSQMNHPMVVKIMGSTFSDEKKNLYLPMEFVEGETISHQVHTCGQYSESKAVQLMAQILEAMAYVHSTNNVHRDIKPSNIMIRPDGSVCVIDFGIAKDMKTHTGKTIGRVIGTDGYMSPEQTNGLNIDHRTDIYSLGCLLHFMLTGQDAITKKHDDYATRMAILHDEFPCARDIVPNLSEHIQQVIYKAVDKNMLHRYQTAMEFRNDLINTSYSNEDIGQNPDVITVTVGRRNCDVIIHSEYVSSHHLDITWTRDTMTDNSNIIEYLTISDNSTNGIGINGQYLHHENKRIIYRINQSETKPLPQILLAGRPECELNWECVISKLKSKGMTESLSKDESQKVLITETRDEEKLNKGLCILCFLFPIVGWILGYMLKKEHPQQAALARKLGWFGFGVGLIINVICKCI